MTHPKRHTLHWVVDDLSDDVSYIERPMFGCLACYHQGRLKVVLADKEEPWSGVLIPTEREFHAMIQAAFPECEPHPVLGKWLYLSKHSENFEETIGEMIREMRRGAPHFGVEPEIGRSKSKRRPSPSKSAKERQKGSRSK